MQGEVASQVKNKLDAFHENIIAFLKVDLQYILLE